MLRQQQPIIIVWSDWDNTMMASAARFYEVLRKTAEELQNEGLQLLTSLPAISTKPHDEILLDLFGNKNFSKVKPVFQKHYDQIFAPELLKEMQMFPGVKEMLHKVPDAQVFLGIISSHYEEGDPKKKDGIRDHLIRNKVDPSKILIIGVDTLKKHSFSPKFHAKPSTTSGELSLKLWGIDPKVQTIKALMFGDGKSDIEFAKNMDQFLKSANQNSSYTGVLFNTVLSGEPIFSQTEIANMMRTEESKDSSETYSNRVAMGYGKLFTQVRNLVSPFKITDEMLEEGRKKLLKRSMF